MHVHTHPAVPWLLVAVLGTCALIGLVRVIRSHADDDLAHVLMNSTMAAMLLDSSMSLGNWWITITLTQAGFLAAQYVRRPDFARAVHVGAAVLMVVATVMMLSRTTGTAVAHLLAAVVIVDIAASVLLAVAGRAAALPGGGTIALSTDRAAVVPHIGMGIGMVAMLVGA